MAKRSKRFLKLQLVIAAILSRCVIPIYTNPEYMQLSCGESGCTTVVSVGTDYVDASDSTNFRFHYPKLTFETSAARFNYQTWEDAADKCGGASNVCDNWSF